MFLLLLALTTVAAAPSKQGCWFDGTMYAAGDRIIIRDCLGSMLCKGNNLYDNLETYGASGCPDHKRDNGQTGCLFDGHIYNKGDTITIEPCLAEMNCLGFNSYGSLHSLGGVCPLKTERRDSSEVGCLFDGTYYAPNSIIHIAHCLGQMKCLGNNNLGSITLLHGECPKVKREVDGQTGCLYDGTVYAKGDVIPVKGTNTKLTCQGSNIYTEQL